MRLQAKNIIKQRSIIEIDKEVNLKCYTEKGEMDIVKAKTKRFYIELIKPKAKKLKEDFLINDEQLKIVYSLPHKICRETYVKNFQYRILNYILYTNDWLYKFEITDSPLCPFCRNEIETIYHLFYYCTFVQSFWHQFESFLTEANNKTISISFDQIFLGDIQITALPLKNYLILLGKIHIYTCRRNKVHPTLQG